MISPETYIQELEGKPYSALMQERHELLTELKRLEASFAHPEPSPIASIDPSPGLQYKMRLEYLAALTDLMRKRAGELTGEPDLEDDIEDDLFIGVKPEDLDFSYRRVPMLDAEAFDIHCSFTVDDLHFDLSFEVDTDRSSNRRFLGLDPQLTVEGFKLTCEGTEDDFKAAWTPEACN